MHFFFYVPGRYLLGGSAGYVRVLLVTVSDWTPHLHRRRLGLLRPGVFHQHPSDAGPGARMVVEVLLEIHLSSHHSGTFQFSTANKFPGTYLL